MFQQQKKLQLSKLKFEMYFYDFGKAITEKTKKKCSLHCFKMLLLFFFYMTTKH